MNSGPRAPVLYIPHGGGPLPLLGDPGHTALVEFLRAIPAQLGKPKAILVISAHWEEAEFTLQSRREPELLYDYYGFPAESYEIKYNAPVAHNVANRTAELLSRANLGFGFDAQRGFDHGLFVPLKLMFPQADIPCLQLSLRADLDPAAHIALGEALAPLRDDNILILGSGSSFHNMTAFKDGQSGMDACQRFDRWLNTACCEQDYAKAKQALISWNSAPDASYAHPREEHLIPLHVCLGAAVASAAPAQNVFHGDMMGYCMSAFLWR